VGEVVDAEDGVVWRWEYLRESVVIGDEAGR
jgi:hypothetical protein